MRNGKPYRGGVSAALADLKAIQTELKSLPIIASELSGAVGALDRSLSWTLLNALVGIALAGGLVFLTR